MNEPTETGDIILSDPWGATLFISSDPSYENEPQRRTSD